MKKSRHKSPQFRLRPLCAAVLLATAMQAAQANPTGGSVVNGQASISTSGNTLTVTNTPGAIIHWQDFSIGTNEITRFVQQSAASTVLNRVVSSNPSNILGSLQSNGRVFLVNPNGIIFGMGATIDVAGLVATSLNLSDDDFLAGRHRYTEVPGAQKISNAGNITAQSGGQIYLIAPDVENTGVITAPNGEILLAAGHSVELVDSSEPSLRVNITAAAGDATNVGQLVAEAGNLGLFGTVVKSSGTVSADSATMQGGKIVFKARQRTEISGTASADGTTGGLIEALGDQVGIMEGASLSADGAQGGGTILVGGDYQGKNPEVQNATVTYVAATATISADATDSGDGGKVIVWADDTTRAYGNISARGGVNGGDGGFVETSGKNYLDVGAIQVDRSAPMGQAGTWLLDPTNVTIDLGGAAGDGAFNVYTPGLVFEGATTNPTILWSTITTNLSSGPVMITTTSGTSGVGNIFFAGGNTYSYTSTNDLWIVAQNSISGNGINLANSGSGDLRFIAGWDGAFPGSRFDYTGYNVTSGTGAVTFLGSSVSTAGDIFIKAGSDVTVKVAFPTGNVNASMAAGGNLSVDTWGDFIISNAPIAASDGDVSVTSGGSQTINLNGANSDLIVSASTGGFGGMARLYAGGTQTIDFKVAGTHAITLTGGAGANTAAGASASIESGGVQQILNSGAGTLTISLTGGDVIATGLSSTDNGTTICASCATHNSATIKSLGAQTINATTLTLTGGSGGNSNSAHIESTGVSNITVSGVVTLTGGSSGGTYITGFSDFKGIVGNDASLDSDTSLTLNAGSLVMLGGTATYGGAFIGAPIVDITTTGNMGMTGGGGSSGGAIDPNNPYPSSSYVWFNPVAIGNDTGTPSVTLNVGGDLTITGGTVGATGGSQAMIGSLGVADVTINGDGSVTLNSANQFAERIGSWKGLGGSVTLQSGLGGTGSMDLGLGLVGTGATGSVTLVADGTGAAITQNASGRIEAATLDASTSPVGSLSLPGSNKVGSVTLSANGNVAYNSIISFLADSVASTTGSVALTTTGAGDISIGTLSAGTSATVNAYGAIYETNGVGVTDITAKSVSLTSGHDGTSGGLAISADVSLLAGGPPTISASVAATSTYGGIRIQNTGSVEPTSVSLTDASTTSGFGWVEYSTSNNVNTSTSAYNLSSQRGGVQLYSDGIVTLANLATFLPGQTDATYRFIDIWGNTGVTISNPGSTTADLFVGTPGAMTLGGTMGANDLGIYAAGTITGTGANITAASNLGIWSDSGVTMNNSSLTASSGSVYLGSIAAVFDTTTGTLSYSGGGGITFTNSSATAVSGDVFAATDGDIRLNNGAYLDAYNDIYLLLAGASSTLYLNDTTGMANDSYIIAAPTTIYLDLLARSSGGVVIDGLETTTTAVGGSGFFSGNLSTPATLGTGLMLTFGLTSTSATVNSIVNEVVVIPTGVTSSDTTIIDNAGGTDSTDSTEEEKKDAPVVEDASAPVAENTSTASLPVCK